MSGCTVTVTVSFDVDKLPEDRHERNQVLAEMFADNLAQIAECDGTNGIVRQIERIEMHDLPGELPPDVVLHFTLPRIESETGESTGSIRGSIVIGDKLHVLLNDHGLHAMAPGEGAPISMDHIDGYVRLCVWSNIRQEDCTDVISLEPAHERWRIN